MIALSTLFVSHVIAQRKQQKQEVQKNDHYLYMEGRIQSRIMLGEKETEFAQNSNYDAIDFNFRRIRLTAHFQGAHWYGGVLDIKAENLLTDGTQAKSGIQEANIWFKLGLWDTKFKLGQFKLPFLREQITSSSRLLISERSFSSETLQQSDIGIFLRTYPLYFLRRGIKEKCGAGFFSHQWRWLWSGWRRLKKCGGQLC